MHYLCWCYVYYFLFDDVGGVWSFIVSVPENCPLINTTLINFWYIKKQDLQCTSDENNYFLQVKQT